MIPLPFGYRVTRQRNRQPNGWKGRLRNLAALLIGNTDLHGLVRCPPLGSRWRNSAGRICDVGCGRGDFHLEMLLRSSSETRVVGIDTDWEALRHAAGLVRSSSLQGRVQYVCASADALPFRDETFGQVFLVDVIEHVPDDERVLAESRRILRRQGLMEISTPTPWYPKIFGWKIHAAVGHVRDGYSRGELRRKLQASGLEILSLRGNTGILTWPWMALWYRLGWLTLWKPGRQVILVRVIGYVSLVIACVGARLGRWLDLLGGYCSNDAEARRIDD